MHRLDTVALLHSCFFFSALSRALDHIPNAFALAQACHKTDLHLTIGQEGKVERFVYNWDVSHVRATNSKTLICTGKCEQRCDVDFRDRELWTGTWCRMGLHFTGVHVGVRVCGHLAFWSCLEESTLSNQ